MSTKTVNEFDILNRVIRPDGDDLNAEAARAILALEFEAADVERMNSLSEKAQLGTLTEAEQHELQSHVNVGHLLTLLQSKARVALKNLEPHA